MRIFEVTTSEKTCDIGIRTNRIRDIGGPPVIKTLFIACLPAISFMETFDEDFEHISPKYGLRYNGLN